MHHHQYQHHNDQIHPRHLPGKAPVDRLPLWWPSHKTVGLLIEKMLQPPASSSPTTQSNDNGVSENNPYEKGLVKMCKWAKQKGLSKNGPSEHKLSERNVLFLFQ